MSAAKPKTILVVDPDARVCDLLEATLRLKDFKVVSTGNAIDTMGFLAGQLPDLIVCELELPEMDGFEFFRRVRGTVRASHVPFVLTSARDDPREGAKALRLGAEEYLRKPFSVDELLVRMERIFEDQQRRRRGDDRPDLEGRLERLGLIDLVYLLEQLRWSGRLTLTIPGEQFQGLALLWQGRIGHVVFGFLQGRAALLQLLLRPRGHFAFHVDERQVVPVVSVEGSAVHVLEQGLQLAEKRWLTRLDVTKEDACKAFQNLLEDQYPASEVPDATADDLVDPDAATATLGRNVDLPTRSATISQSIELLIEDAAEVVDGAPGIGDDERLEGVDETFSADDDAVRSSIIIPRDTEDDLAAGVDVEALEAPPEEERTLEPGQAATLERLFKMLVQRLLGERFELGVESIQITARNGKTLRSTIGDREQQAALSRFAKQAVQFAEEGPLGRYAELAASDLFLMVVELPQGWMLTMVFEGPPPAEELMQLLQPVLEKR